MGVIPNTPTKKTVPEDGQEKRETAVCEAREVLSGGKLK